MCKLSLAYRELADIAVLKANEAMMWSKASERVKEIRTDGSVEGIGQ